RDGRACRDGAHRRSPRAPTATRSGRTAATIRWSWQNVSLVGDAVDGPDRAPALAAGTLPVVRLGAEAAAAAAVHRLPLQQLAGEVAQDQEVLARLALDPVHGGVDQRHQATHRRALAQLGGEEIHAHPL